MFISRSPSARVIYSEGPPKNIRLLPLLNQEFLPCRAAYERAARAVSGVATLGAGRAVGRRSEPEVLYCRLRVGRIIIVT